MNSDISLQLPIGWTQTSLEALIGPDGIFCDGDWVESKDQDPSGDVRLIQLADVGDGDYRDRSNRFLTSAKAAELRCTFIMQGDLLIARMPDPLGRVCVFPGDPKAAVTVVDVCIVRLESDVSSRWLMHQLNAPQMRRRVAELQSGTTRKRISRANLATVTFPVPPAWEQQRIAATLDELLSDLDAGVTALEQVRAKLKQYRASVLKAAVEGSLTAEWRRQHPATEPASALLTRILAERRRRWEEAQLQKFKDAGKSPPKDWKGRYPEPTTPETAHLPPLADGWCWASGEQLFRWSSGEGLNVRQAVEGAYPVYGGNGINGAHTEFVAATPTLVIGRVGEHCGNAYVTKGPAWITDNAIFGLFVPDSGDLEFYRLGFVRARLRHRSAGSGQPFVNQTILNETLIPLAPSNEQAVIVEAVEDQISVIEHLEADLEAKLKSADALRQSILRHAFTGQLVPQDPNDEPASGLLRRIAAEREERCRLARAAKLAKPKTKARHSAKE